MVKRPWGIYVVSVWLFIRFSFWIGPLQKQLEQANLTGQAAPTLRAWIAAVMVLLVFLLVGLIQLRPIHRKVTIGLFGLSIVTVLIRLPKLMGNSQVHVAPYLGLLVLTVAVLDGLAIWYLMRTKFVAACAQYREVADQATAQRRAQKQASRYR